MISGTDHMEEGFFNDVIEMALVNVCTLTHLQKRIEGLAKNVYTTNR